MKEKELSAKQSADYGKELLQNDKQFRIKAVSILVSVGVVVFIISLLSGRYHCSKADILKALGYGITELFIKAAELPGKLFGGGYDIKNPIAVSWSSDVDTILWVVRMPRIIAVIFIGGGLSLAGTSYQCVFRNPLVSEGILGVSNGASLGAVIAIFFSLGPTMTSIFAFFGGILAVALTYSCSRVFRGNPTLLLVLAGTVVGSLLSAGNSILKYLAPQDTKLPEITFWLMGSFAGISASKLTLLVPLIFSCSLGIYLMRWYLNLMSLGDDEAKALGVNTARARLVLIILSTVISSAAVCVCGIVGWIGMVIPQITRLVVGPDARRLLPCTFAVGAIFLMLVDMLCRCLIATEIPVGIITSLIGAPIFLILLKRVKEGWA